LRIVQFFKGAAVAIVVVILGCMHISAFSMGEHTYYLYSSSSQAEIKQTLSLDELIFVTGESVVIEGEPYALADEILWRFGAEVCFTESTGDTLSYYCYSSRLKGGILLNGNKVNLHLALGDGRLVAGTPVIFGGY
jgi:hypothetical protein